MIYKFYRVFMLQFWTFRSWNIYFFKSGSILFCFTYICGKIAKYFLENLFWRRRRPFRLRFPRITSIDSDSISSMRLIWYIEWYADGNEDYGSTGYIGGSLKRTIANIIVLLIYTSVLSNFPTINLSWSIEMVMLENWFYMT